MAKKKSKRSLKGRPRDAKGRLLPRKKSAKRKVKRARTAARTSRAPTKKKRAVKKSTAARRRAKRRSVGKARSGFTRKASKKIRATSGRKRIRVRPRTKKHVVRKHRRKAGVRQRRAGRKTTLVRRHMSWEEAPRRRRRRKARRSVAEEVAMALAKHTKTKRRRRKARRHHAAEAAEARPRRSRRRRTAKVKVSRKVRGKRRSTTVRVSARKRPKARKVTLTRRRRGRRRKVAVWVSEARRPRSRKRRSHRRRSHARRRRHTSMRAFYENPIGLGGFGEGYALENPLSGGELVMAVVTGTLGFTLADVLDRYMASSATGTAAQNAQAIQGPPSMGRIGAQLAAGAIPLGLAYLVKNNMGRATLQGMGLGALFHAAGQIVKAFVIPKVLASNATAQTQLYPDVLSTPPTGMSGLPVGVGAPLASFRLPPRQAGNGGGVSPNPVLTLTSSATPGAPASSGGGGGDILTQTIPGTTPPAVSGSMPPRGGSPAIPGSMTPSGGGPIPGIPAGSTAPVSPFPGPAPVVGPTGGCVPCNANTAAQALQSSYEAARRDTYDQGGCLGGPPGETNPGVYRIPD